MVIDFRCSVDELGHNRIVLYRRKVEGFFIYSFDALYLHELRDKFFKRGIVTDGYIVVTFRVEFERF